MYAFPRIGALTERIMVQRRTDDTPWETVAVLWAEPVALTGKEIQAAESTRPVVSVRWRMRYEARIAGLDTRLTRIVHPRMGIYNATYIEDVRNAHVELYVVTEREDP